MISYLSRFNYLLVLFTALLFLLGQGTVSKLNADTYTANHIPWSGYWWPFNECGLATGNNYYNDPSPLEKYELYTKGFYPSTLTAWYKNTYCSETYVSWAGHCGHWALASIMEDYEILPSSLNNIVFRVGDKKGLLTLMHENEVAISGHADEPDQFHLWLLKYIKDQKTAFIADLDLGEEIWQYPIYKYDMTINRSGSTESVRVEIFYADDLVHPDYIGTKVKNKTYTYNLFLNGADEIIGGEWTGESVSDHPEILYFPVSQGSHAQSIDYNTVRAISQSKDDYLENGSNAVDLDPGTYNLILLDSDIYQVNTETGNDISIDLSLYEGGGDDFLVEVTDSRSQIVEQFTVEEDSPASLKITADFPPYIIRVYKTDYTTPGIYTLKYDAFRPYSTTIGYIPKDGNWSGFAITNFKEQSMEDVCLTSYTEEGKALHTLMGPDTQAAGEKERFLFDNLPNRQHELPDVDVVRISAPEPVGTINLIGTSDGVATIIQAWYKGSHLVLPDTVTDMQINRRMFARVINESDTSSDIRLNLYNESGSSIKVVDITLAPRASYYIRPGSDPFYNVPDSGWIDIECLTPGNEISGFQYIKKNKTLEINPAIPVNQNHKIVPHIPLASRWNTQLVLINNGDIKSDFILHRVMAGDDTASDVNIEIDAKGRIEIDLHELFGTTAADPYYRSILSVTSAQPFTGYYLYESLDYDDIITVPLLDDGDYSSTLVLPHNTQGNGWWTGLGIVNPGSQNVAITIKAYGNNGEPLTGLEKQLSLAPGQYEKYNIALLFGEDRIGEITYITFETGNSSRKIGGFFMYGHKEQGLCGGNLQAVPD